MKQYALFDWDGTLRAGYTLFEWIDFLRKKGGILSPEVLKRHDGLLKAYKEGRITHDVLAAESCLNYECGIRGLSTDLYDRLKEEYSYYDRTRQLPFVPHLFRWLKDKEIAPVIITGAPLDMICLYFKEYGIKEAYGHRLEEKNGALTGRALENHGFGKERMTEECRERFGGRPVLAAGDSESDLPLLKAAEIALVVGGKKSLLEQLSHGISVDREETGEELIKYLEQRIGEIKN